MADDSSSKEDLIQLFDELETTDIRRVKTYLSGFKVAAGRLEKAESIDDLVKLIISHPFPGGYWSAMKEILTKLPKMDLLSDPRFKKYFPEDSAEGTPAGRQLQKMRPGIGKVTDEKQLMWQQKLAYINDTTLSISHMKRLIEYSNSVGLIKRAGVDSALGSGFRVGDNFFITNFHVLQLICGNGVTDMEKIRQALVGHLIVCFNYEETAGENHHCVRVTHIRCMNDNPDYAVCELEKNHLPPLLPPGLDTLIGPPPSDEGAYIALIGHPGGKPKRIDPRCAISQNPIEDPSVQLAMSANYSFYGNTIDTNWENETLRVALTRPDGTVYQSSFLQGSSGSPGFDDRGNLVVMHTAGYFIPKGNPRSVIEQGLKMVEIRSHLQREDPGLAQKVFGL